MNRKNILTLDQIEQEVDEQLADSTMEKDASDENENPTAYQNDEEFDALIKEASVDFASNSNGEDILDDDSLVKLGAITEAVSKTDEAFIGVEMEKKASELAASFMEKIAQPMPGGMQEGQPPVMHPATEAAANSEQIIADAMVNGIQPDQLMSVIDAAREQGTKEGLRVAQQMREMEEQQQQEAMMQQQMLDQMMQQQAQAGPQGAPQGQQMPGQVPQQ